jgi:Flp pilus assembly protein TadD
MALHSCLSCHLDGAHPAPGALNRYVTPLDLKPIGCERCHGPGELHVREPGLGSEGFDRTIVNPAHLAPALRESVCEQCHLQGDHRVTPYGRDEADFRPGLPLNEFVEVFFESEKLDGSKLIGQVEQMHASVCFEASGGALGCISCHDPHRRPAPAERVAHFRASCLVCHDAHGCRLAEPERRAREPEDSCIACHMPSRGASDVAHVSMTDHRIPRTAGAKTSAAALDAIGTRATSTDPIVRFGPSRAGDPSRTGADRDLGIALFRDARRRWRPDAPLGGARRALVLLEKALSARPDDVEALEGKAHLLWMQGRSGEAHEVFQTALRAAPDHERLLETAASLAQTMGRHDEAFALMHRVVALNPYCADYSRRLALWHAEAGDWAEAARSARAALELDMSLMDARLVLVESLMRTGDRASARAELRRLLAFDPPNGEAIRKRFAAIR